MALRISCVACGDSLPVSGGHALVTAAGVAVMCGGCRLAGPAGPVAALEAAVRRSPPVSLAIAAIAAVLVIAPPRGGAGAAGISPVRAAAVLAADGTLDSDPAEAFVAVAAAEPPPVAALSRTFVDDGELDITWYHPLAGARRLPGKSDRRFGAARPGVRPVECGAGHCGVDLGRHEGEVVHAALPGVVVRVDRVGAKRGGRYVKLQHPGGFVSYYFHLGRIHPSLVPGIEVAAGEPLGTLGHTGIVRSAPHLHFAVAHIDRDGDERFVDPEPMLRRAVLLDEAAPFPADSREPSTDVADDSATDEPVGADDE